MSRSPSPLIPPSFLWPDLSQRVVARELMDDPQSDSIRLERTLEQFVLLNKLLSRSRSLAARVFVTDMLRHPERRHTVVDLGAGGGDFARWLVRYCHGRALRVTVASVDNDPRVAAFARKNCEGWDDIKIVERDARDVLADSRGIDYIYANQFLHHLDDEDIPPLLQSIDRAANRAFLLNDIARTNWGYFGYTLLSAVFFRDSFAFYDGRLSIRRSFTAEELREQVRRAGLPEDASVGSCFPSRIYVWRGPRQE